MGANNGKSHGARARNNRRDGSSPRLMPCVLRLASVVFETPWGWMGLSETTKGIDTVVLPKASRQAVLSELQAASAELLEGRTSSRLQEAQAQLIGYLAGTRRSFDLPLDLSRGTEFSAEGLADSSSDLLRPASILSMGGTSRRGQTVCPRRRKCGGGESNADRDSLPPYRGAGCVARRILRRLAHKTKTAHARRNPG